MTNSPWRRTDRDDGSVLVLTLVMTVVLAMVVVALATYTTVALRTSRVTAGIVDTLASAESGVQYGLERADNGACAASTNDGPINGATVTTTCARVARVENADGLFALVVTGQGITDHAALDTDGSSSVETGLKKINGPIYLGEPMDPAELTNSTQAIVRDESTGDEFGGDVRFDVPGDCEPTSVSPAPESEWADPKPIVSCDSRGWQAIAATPVLNDPPFDHASLTLAPAPTGGACTTYSPGLYGSSTETTLELGGKSFFASGIYYFENVEIRVEEEVAVGKRTDLAPPADVTDFPFACTTAWNSDAGTGAVWILGGTSRIVVDDDNDADLDMYPREVPTANTPDGVSNVSVIAFGAPVYGYAASALDADAADNADEHKLITRGGGNHHDMSFYGLVYAPASWIDTNTSPSDVVVAFLGGIVAARVNFHVPSNVDGFAIFVPTSLVFYYLVASTATTADAVTTVRTVSRQTPTGLEVVTWRVCGRSGC